MQIALGLGRDNAVSQKTSAQEIFERVIRSPQLRL